MPPNKPGYRACGQGDVGRKCPLTGALTQKPGYQPFARGDVGRNGRRRGGGVARWRGEAQEKGAGKRRRPTIALVQAEARSEAWFPIRSAISW